MSSRRNGGSSSTSASRAAEQAANARLRMDRNPQHARITDPSLPAGRRKEIDNVMKKARASSPGSFDRKLLEVEQKDPNRWRHTGYKQLYLDGSISPSPPRGRSRSPVGRRLSPLPRRSSPPPRRTSPVHRRALSPRKSPIPRRISPPARRPSPIARRASPIPSRNAQRRTSASRRLSPAKKGASPSRKSRRSPQGNARKRPPSPPPKKRQPSVSGSSTGTCSDESCSVCSPKGKKKRSSRSRSPVTRPLTGPAPGDPRVAAMRPTRELLKQRDTNVQARSSREEKVLEWQRRQQMATSNPVPPVRVKREGERSSHARTKDATAPALSPAALAAALSARSLSPASSGGSVAPPRPTLSERFGKIAQWSADRHHRAENMRITRTAGYDGLSVRIESLERPPPALDIADDGEGSPGRYPEEIMAPPEDMPAWDDVRVRYEYYKRRGYLRGLTLADYVKWEEWWYKYQEWLKRERAYERWVEGGLAGNNSGGRRRRSKRAGRGRSRAAPAAVLSVDLASGSGPH